MTTTTTTTEEKEDLSYSRSGVVTKVIRRPSYEVFFDGGEDADISPRWKQFDVIEVTGDNDNGGDESSSSSSLLIGFNTGQVVKWSYKQQQIQRVVDLPPSPQQQQQFRRLRRIRKQHLHEDSDSLDRCIAKQKRLIKLVDGKRNVTLSDDSLALYTLVNDNTCLTKL